MLVKWLKPPEGPNGAERFIERCGRTSWRSHHKTDETSFKGFLERVVMGRHDYSITEHSVVRVLDAKISRLQLLDMLYVNRTIAWERNEDFTGYNLLLNARHAVELYASEIWRENGACRNILGTAKKFWPTLLKSDELTADEEVRMESAHIFKPEVSKKLTVASFFVKDFARVTEVQWVRHRLQSFTVLTGRKVNLLDQPCIVPPIFKEDPDTMAAYEKLIKTAKDFYAKANGKKTPSGNVITPQDARYGLLQGWGTEMVVTAGVEVWDLFAGLRLPSNAQWEIRYGCNGLVSLLHAGMPYHIGPPREEIKVTTESEW